MNSISHPDMVAALVKPGADILASLTPDTVNLWHAATGIAGEGTELLDAVRQSDTENILEELGDLAFYIEQLHQAVDLPREDDPKFPVWSTRAMTEIDGAMMVAIEAGNVLDQVKKAAIYNKPLDVDALGHHVRRLKDAMAVTARAHGCGFSMQDAIDHNIAKLSVRYAGLQYSDQAAQARADKAE